MVLREGPHRPYWRALIQPRLAKVESGLRHVRRVIPIINRDDLPETPEWTCYPRPNPLEDWVDCGLCESPQQALWRHGRLDKPAPGEGGDDGTR